MGRYSSKKRKGTRKQSFKNRKRVKKGGDNHEIKDAAGTDTQVAEQQQVDDAAGVAATADAPPATTETGDNTTQVAATTDAPPATTETEDNTSKDAARDPQADANVNTTGTEQTDTTDANETNANEAGNEDAGPDWKEGQSEEDIKQAEDAILHIKDELEFDQGERKSALQPDLREVRLKLRSIRNDKPPEGNENNRRYRDVDAFIESRIREGKDAYNARKELAKKDSRFN